MRTQYLYIDTRTCSGTPWDFQVSIPANSVKCDPTQESLRISLVRWTARLDWYPIRAPHNTLTLVKPNGFYTLTIPEGTYSYGKFATILAALLNDNKAQWTTGTADATVSYSANTCKYTFTLPNTFLTGVEVPTYKKGAYGFSTPYKSVGNGTITSDVCINFWENEERLLFHCHSIHGAGRHLRHGGSGSATDQSSVLASILVNAYPFTTATYEDDGSKFGHMIHEDHIQGNLRFQITELDGSLATYIGHSHCVIRIDTIHKDRDLLVRQHNSLNNIEDLLRMSLVSSYLSAPAKELPAPQSQVAAVSDLPTPAAAIS